MKRYTPKATGFSLYLLDRRATPDDSSVTEEVALALTAHIPCFTRSHAQHVHEDHEINLVISGSGRFRWKENDETYVTAGQALAVPGGVPHTLEVDEGVIIRGFYIHPELFRQLITVPDADKLAVRVMQMDTTLHPKATSDLRLFHTLQEIFAQAQDEYQYRPGWQAQYLRAIGEQLAVIFLRILQTDEGFLPSTPTSTRVLNVKSWIDRHYGESCDLQTLAKMASLSATQFCVVFRQLLGISPTAYRNRRRLEEACRLLAGSGLSVSEIAARVGFPQSVSFIRLFKAHYGVPPGIYRKQRI